MNYYESELAKLDKEDTVTIQLVDSSGNKTKRLDLNIEAIQALQVFLRELELKLIDKLGEE